MRIFSLFRFKKKQPFFPTEEFLREIPTNGKALEIAQNKELTETQAFSELLTYFNHYRLKEENILQNKNTHIYSFKKNIYETSLFMSTVVRSLEKENPQVVNFIRRLGLDQRNSYLFFVEKPSEDYDTMNQKFIDQLVGWMEYVLNYYEANKISQDENHEAICLAIHSKLNVFYDFFYYFLCHMADVRCDNLNSVAREVTIDF